MKTTLLILLLIILSFSETKILIVGRDWNNQLLNWKTHLESLGDVSVDVVTSTPSNPNSYDEIWYADFKNWDSLGQANGTFQEPTDYAIANILPDYLKQGGNIAFLTDHQQGGTYAAPMKTQSNITDFLQTVTGQTTTIWSGGVVWGGHQMIYTDDPRLDVDTALANKIKNGSYTANDFTVIKENDLGAGIGALATSLADTVYTNPYNGDYVQIDTIIDDTVITKIVPVWSPDSTYAGGSKVSHIGHLWQSTGWMAAGKEPGDATLPDWAKWNDLGTFVDDETNLDTTYSTHTESMWVKQAEYVGVAFVNNSFLSEYRNGGRVFVFTDIFNALNNNDSNKDILELIAGLTTGTQFTTVGLETPHRTFLETDGDTIIYVKSQSPITDSTGRVDWILISSSADVNTDLKSTYVKSGTLVFNVGDTVPTQQIQIDINDDAIAEPDEVFILRFSNPTTNISLPSDPYDINITILENDQNTHPPVITSDTVTCVESNHVIWSPIVVDPD